MKLRLHHELQRKELSQHVKTYFKEKLSMLLSQQEKLHTSKTNALAEEVQQKRSQFEQFRAIKKNIAYKGNSIIPDMDVILEHYREAIESNSLFEKDQSDFILHDLVPDRFYESLIDET